MKSKMLENLREMFSNLKRDYKNAIANFKAELGVVREKFKDLEKTNLDLAKLHFEKRNFFDAKFRCYIVLYINKRNDAAKELLVKIAGEKQKEREENRAKEK